MQDNSTNETYGQISTRQGVRSPFVRVLTLITGLFVIWALLFIDRATIIIERQRYFSLFDDGMISMRYARRLVQAMS